jgi:hypothetical protein
LSDFPRHERRRAVAPKLAAIDIMSVCTCGLWQDCDR